jgi:hypothetical protein
MVSYGSNSSQQSTDPWEAQQPYLKQLYGRAQGLSEQGNYEYGPGRVTGFTGDSMESFSRASQRSQGTALQGMNRDLTEQTMRGDFLGANPYTDNLNRHVSRGFYNTVNSLGSSFGGAGRSGSAAQGRLQGHAEENLARGLGDVQYENYGRERGMMQQAQQNAFQIGEDEWRDINAQRAVGEQKEAKSQSFLDDLVARFQQQQYGTAEKLSEFSNMLGNPVMQSRGESSGMNVGVISCWTAAVFFGWFTDQWFAARRYVMEEAPESFREFYLTHGRELAAAIQRDPELAAEWRPVFEEFAARGA